MDWALRVAKKRKESAAGGSRSIVESLTQLSQKKLTAVATLDEKYQSIDSWIDGKVEKINDFKKQKASAYSKTHGKTNHPNKEPVLKLLHDLPQSKVSFEPKPNPMLEAPSLRAPPQSFDLTLSNASRSYISPNTSRVSNSVAPTQSTHLVSLQNQLLPEKSAMSTQQLGTPTSEHEISEDIKRNVPNIKSSVGVVEKDSVENKNDDNGETKNKSPHSANTTLEKKPLLSNRIKRRTNLFVPIPDNSAIMAQAATSFKADRLSIALQNSVLGPVPSNANLSNLNEHEVEPIVEEKSLLVKHSQTTSPVPESNYRTLKISSSLKTRGSLVSSTKASVGSSFHEKSQQPQPNPNDEKTNVRSTTHEEAIPENVAQTNAQKSSIETQHSQKLPASKTKTLDVFERLSQIPQKYFERSPNKRDLKRRAKNEKVNKTPAKRFQSSDQALTLQRAQSRLGASTSGTPSSRVPITQKAQTAVKTKKAADFERSSLAPATSDRSLLTPSKPANGKPKTLSPIFQKKLVRQELSGLTPKSLATKTAETAQSKHNTATKPVVTNSTADKLTRFQLRTSSTANTSLGFNDRDDFKQKINKRLSNVVKTQQLQNEKRRLDHEKRKSQLEEETMKQRSKLFRDSMTKSSNLHSVSHQQQPYQQRLSMHAQSNSVLHDVNLKDYRLKAGKNYDAENFLSEDADDLENTTLPDIDSDSDVDERSNILKTWAHEPFLTEQLQRQSSIDPLNVFGRIPPLHTNEIFDTSRLSKFKSGSATGR